MFVFDSHAHIIPKLNGKSGYSSIEEHLLISQRAMHEHLSQPARRIKDHKIVKKSILSIIDHKLLNDIDNLTNPTSEYLCKWIWEKLENQLSGLVKIKLSEDHGTGIIYKGE